MWNTVIDILANYGALGAVALMFLYGNYRRDTQQQESFKILLDTVLENHKESMKDLKMVVRELTDDIRLSKIEFREGVLSIKKTCDLSSAQILTSLYEEKGISKLTAYEMSHTLLLSSCYQAIVDMDGTIDSNGFDTPESVILLSQSIVRIFERRFNELKIRISSLSYDSDKIGMSIESIEGLANIVIESLCMYMEKVTIDTLRADKNYRKLKIGLRNIVFGFSDDATKILNKQI